MPRYRRTQALPCVVQSRAHRDLGQVHRARDLGAVVSAQAEDDAAAGQVGELADGGADERGGFAADERDVGGWRDVRPRRGRLVAPPRVQRPEMIEGAAVESDPQVSPHRVAAHARRFSPQREKHVLYEIERVVVRQRPESIPDVPHERGTVFREPFAQTVVHIPLDGHAPPN